MTALELLYTFFAEQTPTEEADYTIPSLWTSDVSYLQQPETIVNPILFYTELLKELLTHPLALKQENNPDWIKQSNLYSMMIRTATAYPHCAKQPDKYQQGGTFLKAIAFLPYLKRLGVTTIMLLPVNRYSRRKKKGELGSVYSIASFYELEPTLHDKLLSGIDIAIEFSAFLEAAHRMNMKVIMDFIPRTCALDADLLSEHPDWFYYIRTAELPTYTPPHIDTLGSTLPCLPEYAEALYHSEQVQKHIRKFSLDPRTIDATKWQQITKQAKQQNHDLLSLIETEYGITVAPAFSDCINDPQPVWADITYLRLYLDHPESSTPYLKDTSLPPYLLYDVAKASENPGKIINRPLWDYLTAIIPYYQKHYQLDGARIDMGHALPQELIAQLIQTARAYDPSFVFIAEELDSKNAGVCKQKGYDLLVGDGFLMEPRITEGCLNTFAYRLLQLPLPVMALAETHDTPRLAHRKGGKALSKMLTLLNFFLPNSVPFLNAGQELYEVQPMNLGLDCDETERYALAEDDPYYGKLALFDSYVLHWDTDTDFISQIEKAARLRSRFLTHFTDIEHTYPLHFASPTDMALGFLYLQDHTGLFVVVNTDLSQAHTHLLDFNQLPSDVFPQDITMIFSSFTTAQDSFLLDASRRSYKDIQAGEVRLYRFTY